MSTNKRVLWEPTKKAYRIYKEERPVIKAL